MLLPAPYSKVKVGGLDREGWGRGPLLHSSALICSPIQSSGTDIPVWHIEKVKSACEPSDSSGQYIVISSFCYMRQQGVFLLPPGWNASCSQCG